MMNGLKTNVIKIYLRLSSSTLVHFDDMELVGIEKLFVDTFVVRHTVARSSVDE